MKKSTKQMLLASLTKTARTSVVQVAKKYAKTIVASTVAMASVLAPAVSTDNHWIALANVAHVATEADFTELKNAANAVKEGLSRIQTYDEYSAMSDSFKNRYREVKAGLTEAINNLSADNYNSVIALDSRLKDAQGIAVEYCCLSIDNNTQKRYALDVVKDASKALALESVFTKDFVANLGTGGSTDAYTKTESDSRYATKDALDVIY